MVAYFWGQVGDKNYSALFRAFHLFLICLAFSMKYLLKTLVNTQLSLANYSTGYQAGLSTPFCVQLFLLWQRNCSNVALLFAVHAPWVLSWLAVYKAFDSSCEHELRFATTEWVCVKGCECVCVRVLECALQCSSLFCSFPLNDNINCYFTPLSCIPIVSDGFRFIWFSITFN